MGKGKFLLTIILGIICGFQCIDGLRILGLFPLNGKSHFIMCETLAKALAAKGHQIDVYSHFPLKKPVQNYKDYSLDGTLPGVINNMTYEFAMQFQTPNMQALVTDLSVSICELMGNPVFQQLFESLKVNQPYDVVLVETFVADCFLAWGRYLNVPMVGVMTSNLIDWYNPPLGNPLNTAAVPGIWFDFQLPMSFYERLINTVLYNVIYFQFKHYVTVQNTQVEKFFGPNYPDVKDLPKELDLLLINSHHSLDGIRPFVPAIVPVGGLHIRDDGQKLPQEVQKWLDESNAGCIYFSFGSMVRIETFPKSVLDDIYATFRNIAPVRVLFKIAKPEILPPGLPSNVMTQSWFSQIQVLKHKNMKAFVTHGGLMSTLESIYAGVPLVGIPLFGDQPINVGSQVKRKIATMVDLKEFSAEKFTKAVKEVLENPIYKKNAENFGKKFFDRPMNPVDTAVFWVEYIARHGKKALRSPVVDMPWWQANLIDVYGFIIAVILFICYVIKLVLKKIVNICFSSNRSNTKVKKN